MTGWGAQSAAGSDTDETVGFFANSDVIDQVIELIEAGDHEAAVSILTEAADQGDAQAQYWFALIYFYGGDVEQDLELQNLYPQRKRAY